LLFLSTTSVANSVANSQSPSPYTSADPAHPFLSKDKKEHKKHDKIIACTVDSDCSSSCCVYQKCTTSGTCHKTSKAGEYCYYNQECVSECCNPFSSLC
jgi:hypothetical protein